MRASRRLAAKGGRTPQRAAVAVRAQEKAAKVVLTMTVDTLSRRDTSARALMTRAH